MKRIKKGDEIVVLAGKYKGKTGAVLDILLNDKVLVSGINMIKKCVKPNPQANETGGIIEKEAPIHISNVSLFDVNTKKPSRVGFRVLEDKTKVRVYKSSNEIVAEIS